MTEPPHKQTASSALSDTQRGELRSALQKYRLQLQQQIDAGSPYAIESPFGRSHDEEPHAQENAEIDLELEEHAKGEIELIDAALHRIDLGSYGECCDCGEAIGFPRLQAYPMARRCIACKRDYEQQHAK